LPRVLGKMGSRPVPYTVTVTVENVPNPYVTAADGTNTQWKMGIDGKATVQQLVQCLHTNLTPMTSGAKMSMKINKISHKGQVLVASSTPVGSVINSGDVVGVDTTQTFHTGCVIL